MIHSRWCVFSRQAGIYHGGLWPSPNPPPHPTPGLVPLSSRIIIPSCSQTHSSHPGASSHTLTSAHCPQAPPASWAHCSAYKPVFFFFDNASVVGITFREERQFAPRSFFFSLVSDPLPRLRLLIRGCGDCGLSRRCMKEPWYVPVQSP